MRPKPFVGAAVLALALAVIATACVDMRHETTTPTSPSSSSSSSASSSSTGVERLEDGHVDVGDAEGDLVVQPWRLRQFPVADHDDDHDECDRHVLGGVRRRPGPEGLGGRQAGRHHGEHHGERYRQRPHDAELHVFDLGGRGPADARHGEADLQRERVRDDDVGLGDARRSPSANRNPCCPRGSGTPRSTVPSMAAFTISSIGSFDSASTTCQCARASRGCGA